MILSQAFHNIKYWQLKADETSLQPSEFPMIRSAQEKTSEVPYNTVVLYIQ